MRRILFCIAVIVFIAIYNCQIYAIDIEKEKVIKNYCPCTTTTREQWLQPNETHHCSEHLNFKGNVNIAVTNYGPNTVDLLVNIYTNNTHEQTVIPVPSNEPKRFSLSNIPLGSLILRDFSRESYAKVEVSDLD